MQLVLGLANLQGHSVTPAQMNSQGGSVLSGARQPLLLRTALQIGQQLAALLLPSLLAGLVNFQRSSGFGLWWRKNCELHLVAAFFQGTLDGP